MKYSTYVNMNVPLRNSMNFPHFQHSSPLSNYSSMNPNEYSFNNNNNEHGMGQPHMERYLSRNKSNSYQFWTEAGMEQIDDDRDGNLDINNRIEMINMKMKCDILLAKIENLNVMLPRNNKSNKLRKDIRKYNKEEEKRKRELLRSSNLRNVVYVNNKVDEDENLSHLADELVDVFGLDETNNENEHINDKVLSHNSITKTNEELTMGELITETVNNANEITNPTNKDNTSNNKESQSNEKDSNMKNNYSNILKKISILNIPNESSDNNVKTPTFQEQGVQTSVENRTQLPSSHSQKTISENENDQFHPTIIQTLPDFEKDEQQSNNNINTTKNININESENESKQQLSHRSLNTEEEEDLILSTIMANATRMEEERNEELKKLSQTEEKKIKKKKNVSFNENDFRLIEYHEKDVITKLNIYDNNYNKIDFVKLNYSQYVSLLKDITKGIKKCKSCIIGNFKYKQNDTNNKQQPKQHNKTNSINVPKKKKNCNNSCNKSKNNNNIRNDMNVKNKIKSTSHNKKTTNTKVRQKPPHVNCKRFIDNPQKFFTEDLCDNVLNSYNLKPKPPKHHPLNKSMTKLPVSISLSSIPSTSPPQYQHTRKHSI